VGITPKLWETVKTLFHAALERPPAERTAFIEQNCSDPDIRREVATLLEGYKEAGSFLSAGKLDSEPKTETGRLHPGEILAGRFNILHFIAAGGMGEVYAAEDLELRERVAIKIISPEILKASSAVARFKREVQLARKVTHPNICRLYDFFRHQHKDAHDKEPDLIFVSMELLEGETLSARLHRQQRMRTDEALPMVTQMAAGLAAAHRAGVVHRDFKPGNVMLVGSGVPESTRAVITDFGLAVRQTGSEAQSTVTSQQVLAGTPAYMAPEVVKGETATSACDIYALGLVMYEMVTGRLPFQGETPMSCAVKRLAEPPVSPRQLVPELPRVWERSILRCLELEPAARFSSASDVPRALSDEHPTRWFKFRARRGVRAALMIVLLAGVLAGTYWVAVVKRKMRETDVILLADFANSTGEVVFDDTLKQGLSVSLSQSPFLNILPDQKVSETLRLMGHSSTDPVTQDVAREICLRTKSRAMVAGSISSLGSEYVIGVKAVDCNSGVALAQAQVEAAAKEAVLQALDSIARSLRAKLGESLSTVKRYDTPLAEATTSSLAALKAYSTALRKDDNSAIPLLKRSVELDPNFALAYLSMGLTYYNLKESDLANENFRKAYEQRNRVSERERYMILAEYYSEVTGELEKANQVYEQWAQTYPGDKAARGNLGINQSWLGRYEEPTEPHLDPDAPRAGDDYGTAMAGYFLMNRLGEAKAIYEQAMAHKLESPYLHGNRYFVAFLEGDEAEMQRQFASKVLAQPGVEDVNLLTESHTQAYAGRLGKARELSRRAVEVARTNSQNETAAVWLLNSALREAEFGNPEQARSQAASALALAPTRDSQTLAALALARAGDPSQARRMADDLSKRFPLDTLLNAYWLPTIRAAIEIDRKHADKAVELLKAASAYELGSPPPFIGATLYPVYVRGCAYLLLRRGKEAAAEFEKIIKHRTIVLNLPTGALARLGIARAYALQADSSKARTAYQDFFTLWKEADPDIPILKEAKAEYAKLQ
jgi:eukaryotic-like serine/threonine-protein kinase